MKMTHPYQYTAFVIARLIGGLFGGTAAAPGADTIVNLYFLHQRGKGLAVLSISFLCGVIVGQTLSGYISGSAPWTVQFWWSNGIEAAIIVLSLGFLEDTYYYRGSEAESIVLYFRRDLSRTDGQRSSGDLGLHQEYQIEEWLGLFTAIESEPNRLHDALQQS